MSFTIAYVANKGTHTLSAGDGNNTNPNEAAIILPANYSITGSALHFDPNGGDCYPAGQNCAIGGNRDANGNVIAGTVLLPSNGATKNTTFLRRYYGGSLAACADAAYDQTKRAANGGCGWTNDISYYGDDQDTHYNALQATFTKTFSRGLSFNANYAWQRSINFSSAYATWLKAAGKGRDDSTREQQLIAYGLYTLPFGKDGYVFAHSSGLVQQIVGGFQISPIITYASGLPFTINNGSCPNTPGSVNCYVNGDSTRFVKHVTGYAGGPNGLSFYDPQTSGNFTTPGLDQIGNVGRNSIYGPRFFNADLAVMKNVTVHEHYTAQIRLDAYNVFNHIALGNPGGNLTTSGSIGGMAPGQLPRYLQLSGRFTF